MNKKILFLTVSDQHSSWLSKYTDLHRNYDFENWIDGFNNIENLEFKFFNFYEYFVKYGLKKLQAELINQVSEKSYNYIILPTIYYEIDIETLNTIKNLGIEIIVCFFDDSMRFYNYNIYYANVADYIVTHESVDSLKFYNKYDYKAFFFPNYPSRAFYSSHAKYLDELNCDVSFVGANIADRRIYLDELKRNNIDTIFYGKGWDAGFVDTDKMLSIYKSSKISLCFTKSLADKSMHQLKGRMFEICMSGGFLLVEYFPEIENYYKIGEDIETFTSKEEMVEKIKFYLINQDRRETIRRSGEKKTNIFYSHEKMWENFIEKLSSNKIEKNIVITPKSTYAMKVDFVSWNSGFIYGYCENNETNKMSEHIEYLDRIIHVSRFVIKFLSKFKNRCMMIKFYLRANLILLKIINKIIK